MSDADVELGTLASAAGRVRPCVIGGLAALPPVAVVWSPADTARHYRAIRIFDPRLREAGGWTGP